MKLNRVRANGKNRSGTAVIRGARLARGCLSKLGLLRALRSTLDPSGVPYGAAQRDRTPLEDATAV